MPYKKVAFDALEVLEIHYAIGDNPSVSGGCPIALDTKLLARTLYNIDQYETLRGPTCDDKHKLLIPVHIRAIALMSLGYSIDEIVAASTAAEDLRAEIHASAAAAGRRRWDTVNALSERFGRVFSRQQRKEYRKTTRPLLIHGGEEGGCNHSTTMKKNTTAAITA